MQHVPGHLATSIRPPTTIPLWHFLVGLGFLGVGAVLGMIQYLPVSTISGTAPPSIAIVHVLLVGWIVITIMGAMTQFVPVWSGVAIHSTVLAKLQLVCMAFGVVGFGSVLWDGQPSIAIVFAACMVTGVFIFGYNVGRTLWHARPLDITERHFALAITWFVLAAGLGGILALDYRLGVLPIQGIDRLAVVATHSTLAVFGGVITTVIGALYQLGPMFTQSQPSRLDDQLASLETFGYSIGVMLLAGGRLGGWELSATIGGLLITGGVLLAGVVLGRRLWGTSVDGSPMLSRYAIVVLAAFCWSVTAALTWLREPLGAGVRFGHPAVGVVLLATLLGFVVIGSLYHVVPFILWLDTYSDRIGLEPVPLIDDLYDRRVATGEFTATVTGVVFLVVAAIGAWMQSSPEVFTELISWLYLTGVLLVVLGVGGSVGNFLRMIATHTRSPRIDWLEAAIRR